MSSNATASTPPPTSDPSPSQSDLSTGAKAGIGVGVVLGALAVISLLIYLIYRKRGRRWHPGKQKNPPTGYDGAEMHEMQGKDFGHSVTADKSQQPAEMGLQDSIHELQARD
jgi:hypothetical protein